LFGFVFFLYIEIVSNPRKRLLKDQGLKVSRFDNLEDITGTSQREILCRFIVIRLDFVNTDRFITISRWEHSGPLALTINEPNLKSFHGHASLSVCLQDLGQIFPAPSPLSVIGSKCSNM